jgi:LPXTG-site transpeptidase (sortase) family protein
MEHEISAGITGGNKTARLSWVVFVILAVILILALGYLQLIETRAAALQVSQDLTISKSHQGDFLIGTTEVYTILVSNVGTDMISDTITVTDILTNVLSPVGVTATGWDPCGYSGQTVTCVYTNPTGVGVGVTLPAIRLSVDVNPTTITSIVNTATVANINDANPSNDVALDPTNLVGADLSVSKSIVPAIPSESGVVTYTLSVTNLGPSQATGAVLTDTLPAGITFQSSQVSQGTYTNTTGVWSIGTLANGSAATLNLVARVNTGTIGQTIVNTTQGLTSAIHDYDLTNNTSNASFTVQSTQVSGLVTDAATDDPVSGAKVELADSTNKLYTLNTAANGWYTFTNTITTPIATGSATVRVSKTGYVSKSATPFLLSGQNTRQDFSLDTADLLFTKSDGLTTIIPGQTITYTMVISNVGTIPAASVVITDVFPTYLTYITDTLGITHTKPAALTFVWKPAADIDPGEALRFNLRVRVADALPSPNTAITNQARATTISPEANTDNNIAQDSTTSTGTPNPSISISVSPNQLRVNQSATYTILVKNSGTAPMTDVVVEDTFSSFFDLTNATTTKGTVTRNNTTRLVTVNIGVLNPNEEATIRVVVRANTNPSTNTTITNSAKLTHKFGGSTTSRQSNTVSLQILVTTTLPGTGGIQVGNQSSGSMPYLLAYISAVILFILSITALLFAIRNREEQPEWSGWAVKMGFMLAAVALLFGAVGWLLSQYSQPENLNTPVSLNDPAEVLVNEQTETKSETYNLIWPGATPQIPGSELDKLPDFPIPAPTISSSPESNTDSFDITPVNRVVIPAITLDTIVKYVPFDGITWLIAGLKQEVAWMGETSWPGLGGNTALAGHVTLRDGSNGPFRFLFDLQAGDAVFIYTDHNIYEYEVRDKLAVEETDLSVISPTDESQLTLITCSEWDADTGFYTKRYIVNAALVGVQPIERQPQGN